jgi:hypothetical protein
MIDSKVERSGMALGVLTEKIDTPSHSGVAGPGISEFNPEIRSTNVHMGPRTSDRSSISPPSCQANLLTRMQKA